MAGNGTHQYVKWGVAVEAGRLIQALERGWALGGHHVGGSRVVGGHPMHSNILDRQPGVLQCCRGKIH